MLKAKDRPVRKLMLKNSSKDDVKTFKTRSAVISTFLCVYADETTYACGDRALFYLL